MKISACLIFLFLVFTFFSFYLEGRYQKKIESETTKEFICSAHDSRVTKQKINTYLEMMKRENLIPLSGWIREGHWDKKYFTSLSGKKSIAISDNLTTIVRQEGSFYHEVIFPPKK